jgi:hypothetical protein
MGGGVSATGGSTTISDGTISYNSASVGGGVYSTDDVSVTNSRITHNKADNGAGLANNAASVTVSDSDISENTATGNGAGVYTTGGGSTTLNSGSTVSGNAAGSSGGGVFTSGGGTTTLTSVSVTDNTASVNGAGVFTGDGGTSTLTGVTVTGNTAGQLGGGTYTSADAVTSTAGGTIVVDNFPASPGYGTSTSITNQTITYGQSASVQVSVIASGVTPTGNVSLTVDGTIYTEGLTNGSATFALVGLPAGSHSLTASYAAQANFDASSATGTQGVSQAQPSLSLSAGGPVVVGTATPLSATATLGLPGYNETGTMTFTLYNPGGTSVYTDQLMVTGNGTYSTGTGTTTGSAVPTMAGTYQWAVSYSGDANNNSASDQGGSGEKTTVNAASPTVTTTASPAITLGTTAPTLSDSAVLANGYNETGNIVFTLSGPGGFSYTQSDTLTGNGTYNASTTLPTTGTVAGTYTWSVSYAGDANNHSASDQGGSAEQTVVSKANPTITTTASPAITLGTTAPTLSDTAVLANGYYDTGNIVFTLTGPGGFSYSQSDPLTGNGTYNASTTLPTTGIVAGTYTWAVSYAGDANNHSATDQGGSAEQTVVSKANPTITTTASGNITLGTTAPTISDAAVLAGGYYETGNINFTLKLGSTTVYTTSDTVSGNNTYSASYTLPSTGLVAGTYTWSASYGGDNNNNTAHDQGGTAEQTVVSPAAGSPAYSQYIVVLDPTAGGALTISGNAAINISAVYVDSSSTTALSASGNALVKGSTISVYGGISESGNAAIQASAAGTLLVNDLPIRSSGSATASPAPMNGAPLISDPLAGLPVPENTINTPGYTPGLVSHGPVNVSGNSSPPPIAPGIYSQINVSGNASLTLQPGVYIITGGGFNVSGNASVTGTGVMIYNTASTYSYSSGTDGAGAAYGGFNLSGKGTINLTPPSTGTYAGILMFQDRNNAMALNFSGNSMTGITGTIYAKTAQLNESGTAQMGSNTNPISLVVDTLTISGNAIANSLDDPSGTTVYTPAQIRSAYGINGLSLDGTGQTIAIVDAYDDPNILASLDTFDEQFGLTDSGPSLYDQYGPASSFLTVLNQYGQPTSLPTTDPSGAGVDNWEVEEALDVEWVHAITPGAQIILVEANSQSPSDLMAAVATAASQPGVSVVSLSWGFPEGIAISAGDEATYNGTFTTPGVTFVASTGDHGTADPEYPAYSPNVVAVGGTSLYLNANNSYNSETGWGYNSSSQGTFIGSGGGLSLYEPEPAYQQGVQSTGSRTTPDVSLDADPATGAWIADLYNQGPSSPFQAVGGTSVSAPVWAGLLTLVNQGRVAAGKSTLNSSSPTETQTALYSLSRSDYNSITSGFNGYTANLGYNLVTGLGTPVANSLVSDLVAYRGPGTSYAGPTVGPLQDATLTDIGSTTGNTISVFSVFNAFTVTSNGLDSSASPIPVGVSRFVPTPVPAPAAKASAATVTGLSGIAARSSLSPSGLAGTLNPATNSSPAGLVPLPSVSTVAGQAASSVKGLSFTQTSTSLVSPWATVQQPAGSSVQPLASALTGSRYWIGMPRGLRDDQRGLVPGHRPTGAVLDSALDELMADAVLGHGQWDGGSIHEATRASSGSAALSVLIDPSPEEETSEDSRGSTSWLADLLLAAGPCSLGAVGIWSTWSRKAGGLPFRKESPKFEPQVPSRRSRRPRHPLG